VRLADAREQVEGLLAAAEVLERARGAQRVAELFAQLGEEDRVLRLLGRLRRLGDHPQLAVDPRRVAVRAALVVEERRELPVAGALRAGGPLRLPAGASEQLGRLR